MKIFSVTSQNCYKNYNFGMSKNIIDKNVKFGMKFDEKKLDALEKALGEDFFKVFGQILKTKMRNIEINHRNRLLQLSKAKLLSPNYPCNI